MQHQALVPGLIRATFRHMSFWTLEHTLLMVRMISITALRQYLNIQVLLDLPYISIYVVWQERALRVSAK